MNYSRDDIKNLIANMYVCDNDLELTALADQVHLVLTLQAQKLGRLTDAQVTKTLSDEIGIFETIKDDR